MADVEGQPRYCREREQVLTRLVRVFVLALPLDLVHVVRRSGGGAALGRADAGQLDDLPLLAALVHGRLRRRLRGRLDRRRLGPRRLVPRWHRARCRAQRVRNPAFFVFSAFATLPFLSSYHAFFGGRSG